MYCGLTQGLFYDRYGPRKASLLAAFLLFLGYLSAFGASFARQIPPVTFAVCFFLIGQGSHGYYTARLARLLGKGLLCLMLPMILSSRPLPLMSFVVLARRCCRLRGGHLVCAMIVP